MILVFGDGKIIERGNHDELLKQNGVYASMWKRISDTDYLEGWNDCEKGGKS